MNCLECGATLREHDIACTACGRAVKPARQCPQCHAAVANDARFCPACSTALTAAASGPDTPSRSVSDAPAPMPSAISHTLRKESGPVAVVAIACVLAAAVFWLVAGDRTHTQKAPAQRPPAKAALTARPADDATGAQAFPMKQAFEKLYGSYDLNLDGAFWKVNQAPGDYAQWAGRTLLIRPLVSRSFDENGSLRHVVVTNSLDVKDGIVVKQGTGCRTCGSLVGAAIFQKQGNGWALISRHDFLAVDGAFGAPPKVSVAFPAEGGIALQFERSHLIDRAPEERSYSIVLKERRTLNSAMR